MLKKNVITDFNSPLSSTAENLDIPTVDMQDIEVLLELII